MSATIMPHPLAATARSHGSRVALSFADRQWTFADLQATVTVAAQRIAATWAEKEPPSRLGILAANCPGYVFAVHAAPHLGVSVVPLNWRLTPAELAPQVRDANIGLLLVDEPRLQTAAQATANIPTAIMPIADLECPSNLSTGAGALPTIHLAQEAVVMFTSGTTGQAKGARLTYGNLWFSAVASSRFLDQHQDDIWLAPLALHHIGGLSILYRGLIDATRVILLPRFEAMAALESLERGVTHVSLVPTMLREMIALRGDRPWPSSLRCVLLGGAATPPALLDVCFALGLPVAPTYGLTESASQATTLLPDAAKGKRGSSGLPLPTTQLRITNAGKTAPAGEIGEIELRAPTVFAGYLGAAERATSPDGWFSTGDAGYLDDEGYLYVVDRRDDLIVSGGENVYPAEIERVLLEHPHVADAGVVGLSHATWGARPAAAVVWKGEPATMAPELLAFCRSRLASYKVPDRILALDELPRSASGKLLRHRLRALVEDQEAAAEAT